MPHSRHAFRASPHDAHHARAGAVAPAAPADQCPDTTTIASPAGLTASLEIERRQFLPAPLTIGVIFSPRPNPKAPELEQLLSAGNVCFNLCHAAFALGYAASWVTRWFGLDPAAQAALGARGGERFVGFVHIGTPAVVPEDRDRPRLEDVVSRWPG